MRNIHLRVRRVTRCNRHTALNRRIIELLRNLEKPGLDFILNFWTKLLFGIVHFHLLLFEMFQQSG